MSTNPLSVGSAPAPVSNPIEEASTSAHPLSEMGVTAPVHDSITEAPASPQHLSAGDRPVHGSTAEGSTTEHYTPVTLDMVNKEPKTKFYNHPAVKSAAKDLAVIASISSIVVGFIELHNKMSEHHNGD